MRPDRGHLADLVRRLLLPERGHTQQRPERDRRRPLGHSRQAVRRAGLQAPRRQGPRGGTALRPRQRHGTVRRSRTRYAGGKPRATATSACSSAVPGYATYGASGETSKDVQQARPDGRPALARLRAHAIRQQHDQDVRVPAREARLRRRADPRRPRAGSPGPGHPAREGAGTVPAVLPRRSVSRPRTRPGSSTSARRPRLPWRWESCSSIATSGCRW